jgi:hypothetical protein
MAVFRCKARRSRASFLWTVGDEMVTRVQIILAAEGESGGGIPFPHFTSPCLAHPERCGLGGGKVASSRSISCCPDPKALFPWPLLSSSS